MNAKAKQPICMVLLVKDNEHSCSVLRWLHLHAGEIKEAGITIKVVVDEKEITPSLIYGDTVVSGASAIMDALSIARPATKKRKQKSAPAKTTGSAVEDFMLQECYKGGDPKKPNTEQDEASYDPTPPPSKSAQPTQETGNRPGPPLTEDEMDAKMMNAWQTNH